MSEIMLKAVIRMPFEMAMNGEIARYQYWQRANQALAELEQAQERIAALEEERALLLRGEYICQRCGLRKDAEGVDQHAF